MKPSDLKPGYVVRYRGGNLRMVIDIENGRILVDEKGYHGELSTYAEDLTKHLMFDRSLDIVEVWGFAQNPQNALSVSTKDRKLLWKREEKPAPKKMTVSEVCKALGYDIEIVKDSDNA